MLENAREGLVDRKVIQQRLFALAVVFMSLFSIVLSVSPAVRIHSWDADYRWQHWLGYLIWLVGFTFTIYSANKFLPDHDPYLLPIISFLSGWGLLTIWRIDEYFGFRQTMWLFIILAH